MFKKIKIYILILVLLPLVIPQQVFAVSDFFSDSEIQFYDPNACDPNGSPEQAVSTSSSGEAISSVYMRGDSITLGAKDSYKLNEKFETKNIKSTITASGGGTVARAGNNGDKKSGLSAIQSDKEKIKDVDAVVVAYGTNNYADTEELFTKDIKDMVAAIKEANGSAKIFWVNIKIKDSSKMSFINDIIRSMSASEGYTVIDMASATIPMGDDFHPAYDETGFGKWGQLVVDAVAESGSAGSTQGAATSSCCSAASATTLSGSNNEEKTWNFFIGKGLSVDAVAGIMGNLSIESGFQPDNTQDPTPDTKDPSGVSVGWGIIQWTPGSKVLDAAKRANVTTPIHELNTQLEVVWYQANHYAPPSGKGIIEEYKKQSTDPRAAASAWERLMEAPASPGQENRMAAAQAYVQEYGGKSSPSDAATPGVSNSGACCMENNPTTSASSIKDGSPSEWVKMYTGANRTKTEKMSKGKITNPKVLAIHYTVGAQDGQDLLNFFSGTSEGTGIQFNVGADGKIYQYFPLNDMRMTYHAKGVNQKAIGIEITGYSSKQLLENEEQFKSVASLAGYLCDKYNIPCSEAKGDMTNNGAADAQGMLGHDEIPTNDHIDPDAEFSSISAASSGSGAKVYGTSEAFSATTRKDSSKHAYMKKLRETLGYNPTPGSSGGSSGTVDGGSGPQAKCPPRDEIGGNGTEKDPVGQGENRSLALEAVKYDTETNDGKYKYEMGGLHGPISTLEKFAEDGGLVDCSGFIRYVIWRVYGTDISGMATGGYPSSKYFQEIEAKDVAAGDVGWRADHVDYITENKGGGKLHQFGAHSSKTHLYGGDTTTDAYEKFFRYIGPKGSGGGD